MKITDFLTVLGLLIAAWAIIPRKERKFVQLFFLPIEHLALIAGVIFMHWLIVFDWIRLNWWPCLDSFVTPKGIPANGLAYVLLVIELVFVGLKVVSFFPRGNKEKVIELYKELLNSGEYQTLVAYINKYHLKDIKKYLAIKASIPRLDEFESRISERSKVEISLDKDNRMSYARSVYYGIIQEKAFIETVAISNPELFASILRSMTSANVADDRFVKLFLEVLIDNMSYKFINELKETEGSCSSLPNMVKSDDLVILRSVLGNMKVATANYVWWPFGERGLQDLKYNEATKDFLIQEYDERWAYKLWEYRIELSIQFINVMVRESIYKEGEWHMWLFYYDRFAKEIIENIPRDNTYNKEAEKPSFNHHYLYEILHNMIGWIQLAVEQKTQTRIVDACKCIGKTLYLISQADEDKVSMTFKRGSMDAFFGVYFKEVIFHAGEERPREDLAVGELIREWVCRCILDPKNPDNGRSVLRDQTYIDVLAETWRRFDNIPYLGSDSYNQFVRTVITPLHQLDNRFTLPEID